MVNPTGPSTTSKPAMGAELALPPAANASVSMHPPEHLPAWPDEDRRSRVVFIGCGFSGEELKRSLEAFNRAAGGR
jgi:cobalamin synthesis protein cobW-like protein